MDWFLFDRVLRQEGVEGFLSDCEQICNFLVYKRVPNTVQKVKFSLKDFFSKCDQIRSFLRIRSHLLKKSLMENFIFFCSEKGNFTFSSFGGCIYY